MLPFSVLSLIVLVGFIYVFVNSSSARYTDHIGTVCCMSEKYYADGDREPALKMMTVDLDDGRRVDVPIRYREFFVSYLRGHRILVRQVRNMKGAHPRFMAVRYLARENS